MKTEKIPLERIKLNEANPRTITEDKFTKLVNSILVLPKMLFLRPVVIDGASVALGGNMRCRALRFIQDIPEDDLRRRLDGIIDFQNKTEKEKQAILEYWVAWKDKPTAFVIKASDLTDAEKREFIIKDNVGFGAWDWDMLANDWDEAFLKSWGLDIGTMGDGEGKKGREDGFDEDKDAIKVRCKPGDVWILGEHRLMCGDSTDATAFSRLMNGGKADMVFTDPPYGVAIGDKNKVLNEHAKGGICQTNIKNDKIKPDELYGILVKAMSNCRENSKDDASYFVTSPQGGELGLMMMMMRDAGLPVRHMLIWKKNNATFSLGRLDYDYQHEPIFYTWTKSHHNYRKGEFRTTIWEIDKPHASKLHPTMKPVELVANCLNDTTNEGDIVLDSFGGSGTTLIACEQLGRKARVMELDPHYCDVILARWEKESGREAVLEG